MLMYKALEVGNSNGRWENESCIQRVEKSLCGLVHLMWSISFG